MPGHEREQSVVAAEAYTCAGSDPGSALPDQDVPGLDGLAAVDLDSEHLGVRVATVAGRTAAFLVCHYFSSLTAFAALAARGVRAGFWPDLWASASGSVSLSAFAPPNGRISSAVRSARPPRCTRTRFFDL